MSRKFSFSLALACCVLMVACGGSMKPSPTGNGVPVSLAIRDTPPNGVAVLFFEDSITGVSLQPTEAKKHAVSLMTAPVEVEFGHLKTDTAFMSLGSAAADSYQNETLTFGNAVLTIVNHYGNRQGVPDHDQSEICRWNRTGFRYCGVDTKRSLDQPHSHGQEPDPER